LPEIQIGAAKVNKYATSDSGDTVEVVERPRGGVSVVLVDGQSSGEGAKTLSNLVTAKAVTLLKEGVRDGAVARAVHDYLHAYRHGKVSATLNILSADLKSKTIVVSRNNPCPVIVVKSGRLEALGAESIPIGIYHNTKPVVTEIPAEVGTYVFVFTDGVSCSGRRYGENLEPMQVVQRLLKEGVWEAPALADGMLTAAMALDRGRPGDDISVVVLGVVDTLAEENVRRMQMTFPLRS
jgi:serine phosphatase RsbU (regulator of sigma subunit)